MKLGRLACFSVLALGCSDLDGPSVASPEPQPAALPAAMDRGEALRRAAHAGPVSSLFTSDAPRSLRFVDAEGHVQLPERFLLNLNQEHQSQVRLGPFRRHGDSYEVWRAQADDSRLGDMGQYENAVFVINRRSNTLHAAVDVAGKSFEIRPTSAGYVVEESERFDPQLDCGFEHLTHPTADAGLAPQPASVVAHSEQQLQVGEQDDCGTYILDVFFGFTQSAAQVLDDIEAHALLLTETANSGLSNSGIENVRLRMVGAQTTSWEPAGDGFDALSEALRIGRDFLEDEAAATGSDFQAAIISQAAGSGLAYAPGNQSAVGPDKKAWRHEWGHNAGSSHCSPESNFRPYAHGWDAGPGHATHMCGNEYNMFSNPLVTIDGYKMGNEAVADNTRLIRERAEEMANETVHMIPYEPCRGGSGGAAGVGGAAGGGAGGGGGAGMGGVAIGGAAGAGDHAGTAGQSTGGTAGNAGAETGAGGQAAGAGGSAVGAAGGPSGGSSGAAPHNAVRQSSGCDCRLAGARTRATGSPWLASALFVGALGVLLRRRQR